jgi:hypothetical protein
MYPASYAHVISAFDAHIRDESFLTEEPDLLTNATLSHTHSVLEDKDGRATNPLSLRKPAKVFIRTYNAHQKVYRAMSDEGRSNARLQDKSNSFLKYRMFNAASMKHKSLLGKNRESFFKLTNYNSSILPNFSNLHNAVNSLNIYFTDLPFLLSTQSDQARYI